MTNAAEAAAPPHGHRPWYRILYVQVLIAIALGILLGRLYPHAGVAMKPLGDGFIALIRMMIAPVIFCTVVHGIASMRDLGKVGRVGLKAIVYFEVVSTIALGVGLLVGEILQPGKGFNIDPATIDPKAVGHYVTRAREDRPVAARAVASDAVLAQMTRKMGRLGASEPVVGLVIPTGSSFNLDGTNIYMTLATLFLAQATNTPLGIGQELTMLAIAMITSKGASGVTGAGFVTLAATLAIIPDIPIQSLAVIVGIDRFMSECRALTNLVGNGVATLVVSRWEGELDRDKLNAALDRPVTLGEEVRREAA